MPLSGAAAAAPQWLCTNRAPEERHGFARAIPNVWGAWGAISGPPTQLKRARSSCSARRAAASPGAARTAPSYSLSASDQRRFWT